MLKKLISIANELDAMGLVREASEIDDILLKISGEISMKEVLETESKDFYKFGFFTELNAIIKMVIEFPSEYVTISKETQEINLSDHLKDGLLGLYMDLKEASSDNKDLLDKVRKTFFEEWLASVKASAANIEAMAKLNIGKVTRKFFDAKERQEKVDALRELNTQDILSHFGEVVEKISKVIGGAILDLAENSQSEQKIAEA